MSARGIKVVERYFELKQEIDDVENRITQNSTGAKVKLLTAKSLVTQYEIEGMWNKGLFIVASRLAIEADSLMNKVIKDKLYLDMLKVQMSEFADVKEVN